MNKETKEKEYRVSNFQFIEMNDNILPREDSIVDWIQTGIVSVKGAKMKKKYQKRFRKEYIGKIIAPSPLDRAVIFNEDEII